MTSTFDGQPVTDGDIHIKYTWAGDASLDGIVNGSDYTRIDNGFNGDLSGWQYGDFNYDGVVNGDDYTLIDNPFNSQGGPLDTSALAMVATATAQVATSASSVPEPCALGLLCLGAIGLLGRRGRRV